MHLHINPFPNHKSNNFELPTSYSPSISFLSLSQITALSVRGDNLTPNTS